MNSSLGGNYVKRMANIIIATILRVCPPIVMPMILLGYVCRVGDGLVHEDVLGLEC